jgi:amino acid transporter
MHPKNPTKKSVRQPLVFARETTGLVKAASSGQAAIWNVAGSMGSKFPWSVARLGIFPAVLIMGWSPYLWTALLVGLGCYLLAIISVQTTCAMPRSGADYVVPSRLIGPFWGWIQSWMLVCTLVPLWGYNTWVTIRNIKQLFDILRIGGITNISLPWILDGFPALFIGVVVIIIGTTICFMPAKRYYQTIGVVGGLAVFSLLIMEVGAAMVSQPAFSENMRRLLGVTPESVLQNAITNGFNPNQGLDFAGTASLAGLSLFALAGFQFSANISGELKGNVRNSLLISILGSLTFYLAIYIPFVWLMLSKFNYNLVLAWSYLFWNAKSGPPLSLPPINALLLTIAFPNAALLWAVAGLAAIIGGWLAIPVQMLYINRTAIYWGMDRMVPSTLSEINPRFHQPMKLVAIEGILATAFFGLTLLKVNPITYLWWGTLLLFPTFIFPGISALMLSRRRPELLHSVPWRKWLTPLAIVWLIFIVPLYAFAGFIGSVPSFAPSTLMWQYAMSTGLEATLFAIVAGILIYFVTRAYNVRRKIDVELIFKSIPSE